MLHRPSDDENETKVRRSLAFAIFHFCDGICMDNGEMWVEELEHCLFLPARKAAKIS